MTWRPFEQCRDEYERIERDRKRVYTAIPRHSSGILMPENEDQWRAVLDTAGLKDLSVPVAP